MTTFATQSPATGPWKTADEVSRETGLRPDLVLRFIPHTETPNGPRYNPHHIALAGTVKQMTDAGAPADAIDAAVRDLLQRPDLTAGAPLTRSPKRRNGQLPTVAGITAAIALLIGGVIGGLIGSGNRNTTTAAPAPVTITATAPTQELPGVPATIDPVCDEWGALNDRYRAERADWVQTDANVPASQWTAEQRRTSLAVIPVLRSEVVDLQRLADKTEDPALRTLLGLSASYQEAFTERLPNYVPSTDKALWSASTDFGNAVNSYCNATR
ncbi:hypothetical protein ACNUDN_29325 [Mycobacterium sp. smrl_JER01]|uniref:Uncharacterized protein n=1 Tax=Mycolicibacterium gilvum (strain PYR-GCK) TaxID=350054 RepID=A4TFX2_MYCGI